MYTRFGMLIVCSILARTASGQGFDLSWHSIDAGGVMLSSGGPNGALFELSGTIGQPDAGSFTQPMSGGPPGSEFELVGGFWPVADAAPAILGDVDGDGDVDIGDLTALLSAFGSCSGDPNYNVNADVDGEPCIAIADLTLLLSNFGR